MPKDVQNKLVLAHKETGAVVEIVEEENLTQEQEEKYNVYRILPFREKVCGKCRREETPKVENRYLTLDLS